jgi:hypothetical protein
VRGLCDVLLADCHEKWVLQKRSKAMKNIFKVLNKAFPAGDWNWVEVKKGIRSRQSNRRHLFRKMAKNGGIIHPKLAYLVLLLFIFILFCVGFVLKLFVLFCRAHAGGLYNKQLAPLYS